MTTLLATGDLFVGMRVILVNPSPSYEIGKSNPKVGTVWECEGTIKESLFGTYVDWDNGTTNCYKDYELSPVCEGSCQSIW